MKIAIIQFSPSGYTGKVTSMLAKELKKRNQEIQILDITGDDDFFVRKNIPEFLSKNIKQHDILLIGSPVYAHHLQYHVQDLIKTLPEPDGIWGKYAVPYVCYGGISSGIALKEAATLLKGSGRIIPMGMKVSAPHSMTRAFMDHEFNADKLQSEQLPEIAGLVDRMMQLEKESILKCRAKHLDYNGFITALKAKIIFKEKRWHEKRYPQISIDKELCSNCGRCAKVCPVRHLLKNDKMIFENIRSSCIHCFNCISNCPKKAIQLIGDMEKGKAFMAKMIAKNGNKEMPETAVYPILPGSRLQ